MNPTLLLTDVKNDALYARFIFPEVPLFPARFGAIADESKYLLRFLFEEISGGD